LIVNNKKSGRRGVFGVHNSQIPTECGFFDCGSTNRRCHY
jgi:hypothetical protein